MTTFRHPFLLNARGKAQRRACSNAMQTLDERTFPLYEVHSTCIVQAQCPQQIFAIAVHCRRFRSHLFFNWDFAFFCLLFVHSGEGFVVESAGTRPDPGPRNVAITQQIGLSAHPLYTRFMHASREKHEAVGKDDTTASVSCRI